jgi:hypothetical protein
VRQKLVRTACSLGIISLLLVGIAGRAEASPAPPAEAAAVAADEPDPLYDDFQTPTITLDDGTVIGPGDEVDMTFSEESTGSDRDIPPGTVSYCAEVKDPPTYTVKGVAAFLPDTGHPQSTWLLPRQSVSWNVTSNHTFTWHISGGTEAEAGAIIAKAKVKVDAGIANSWTWSGSQTVSDTNSTNSSYRAVLGTVGWKLTSVKTWVAAPCKVMKKTIVVLTPRKGDMSIGRQNS